MHHPERAIAALRIAVGLWFVKSIVTKLGIVYLGGVLPFPGANERWMHVMPKLLGKYAEGNPIGPYREFLLGTAIPHGAAFATLTTLGETAVGIGLVLGLGTRVAAAVGIWLVLCYGLATFWQGASQQGFHLVLLACMLVFIATRAGRRWGVDGWLRRHRPASWLARLPIG